MWRDDGEVMEGNGWLVTFAPGTGKATAEVWPTPRPGA